MKILYLYYNQEKAVEKLKALGYDKCGVEVVFIDDGSQKPLKCDWATVYRIEKDVPWNQPRANNLGFSKMKGEVVMRMDIDHYFTIEDLKRVAEIEPKEKEVFRFERLYKGKRKSENRNVYLARVDDIMKIGGYNETFCGNYGFEDGELLWRMEKQGFTFTLSDIICQVDDLPTKGLSRNIDINYNKFKKIREKSNI